MGPGALWGPTSVPEEAERSRVTCYFVRRSSGFPLQVPWRHRGVLSRRRHAQTWEDGLKEHTGGVPGGAWTRVLGPGLQTPGALRVLCSLAQGLGSRFLPRFSHLVCVALGGPADSPSRVCARV